jgi:DNA-binding beta-propeller fold protein YncE
MLKGTTGLLAAATVLVLAAPAQAASGTWERAWGQDVDSVAPGTGFEICTVQSVCQTSPATGDEGGDLNAPRGIAVDDAGNVYVANTSFNRIDKFDSDGNFIRAWGRDVVEGGITGFENCVAGVNTCKLGTTGTGNGMMSSPAGIAVGASGLVYVSDAGNTRIQEFTADGNFIGMWGKDVVSAGTEDHGTGFEICHTSACKQGAASTGLIGELNVPLAVATDPAGNVYVADSSNNRIQKFDEEGVPIRTWGKDVISGGSTGFEVCRAGIETCKAGTTGGLEGEMNLPLGVAADSSGAVYVTDANNSRVQKFSPTGGFQLTWGKDVINGGGTGFEICHEEIEVCQAGDGSGALGGELNLPVGAATDTAGDVYVSEEDGARVQKFGSDGTFQRVWGQDVDAVATGTDFEICTVPANCKAGAFLAPFRGGDFGVPDALATDAGGRVYVVDRFNNRVDRFGDPPPATVPPPPVTPSPSTTATKKKKCKKKKHRAAAAKKCKKKKRR